MTSCATFRFVLINFAVTASRRACLINPISLAHVLQRLSTVPARCSSRFTHRGQRKAWSSMFSAFLSDASKIIWRPTSHFSRLASPSFSPTSLHAVAAHCGVTATERLTHLKCCFYPLLRERFIMIMWPTKQEIVTLWRCWPVVSHWQKIIHPVGPCWRGGKPLPCRQKREIRYLTWSWCTLY